MKKPPYLHLMPRVDRDIERCVRFVARHPLGNPRDRERDIYGGIETVWRDPTLCAVRARRPAAGVELRRYNAAQFAIIYAYQPPSESYPHGKVSIRAVRHSRTKNVFLGVKEPAAPKFLPADSARCRWRQCAEYADAGQDSQPKHLLQQNVAANTPHPRCFATGATAPRRFQTWDDPEAIGAR